MNQQAAEKFAQRMENDPKVDMFTALEKLTEPQLRTVASLKIHYNARCWAWDYIHRIEDGSHWVINEQSDTINSVIRDFLG